MTAAEYDLVVIGSGPAGQKGAIAAAKARKRVAVIDRTVMMVGVSVHTGTIPSKTLREAIFQLTGLTVKALYGNGYRSHGDISVQDLSSRVHAIIGRETEVVRAHKPPYRTSVFSTKMSHYRSLADLSRRTSQYRRDDIESILPAACGWPIERENRRGFSSAGKRVARLGVPSSR